MISLVRFQRLFIFKLMVGSIAALAQNPITPPGVYMADPEARIWPDGKLYLYGSRDENREYWCSYSHDVLSTTDLRKWTLHENVFSSKGKNDEVSYQDELLFAPDCAYREGIYYLYYCSPHKKFTEGVAVSKSPTGPFKAGKHIQGAYQIDPAVLIDEDGQGYYYWGQGTMKVAKLKPNLMEIDSTTIVKPLDSLGNLYFHEGSSIRKIGNVYYLVFADESRNKRPTCLGYSTSNNPMGPFTYQGVIIDNNGSDPAVWNNHGSIQEYKGQWYIFYHRSTNNSAKFRKVCVEPITIRQDGRIDEVEMTSQGAKGPIPADGRIEAEWACQLNGMLRIEPRNDQNESEAVLAKMDNGDEATYKYLDFGEGKSVIKVKVANAKEGKIEIRTDSLEGSLLGVIELPSTEKNAYAVLESEITKTSGVHALYLSFEGTEGSLLELDWFSFY